MDRAPSGAGGFDVKTLLSLFDASGVWGGAFEDLGWDVITVDLEHGDDVMSAKSCADCLRLWGDVDGILAAVPCTHFTLSCAQYWKAKDSDGRTQQALELVHQTFRIVDFYRPTDPEYYREGGTFFWAMENPVGRLPDLVRTWPDVDYERGGGWRTDPFRPWYFHPWQFAGYLDPNSNRLARLDAIRSKHGEGVSALECLLVLRTNAYQKNTGIWGDYRRPMVRPIDPVRCCSQGSPLQRLGGTSDMTKAVRSQTPAGFARAFAIANSKEGAAP